MKEEKRKIRILHVYGRMHRGGAELRTVDMMRNLKDEKYQFHFCTLSGLPGVLDEEILDLGGYIHPCRLTSSFPWRFQQLLKNGDFDVIHSHVYLFSGLLLRLAWKKKIPIRIAHFRTTADNETNHLFRRFYRGLMKRWINRYATHILAVSEGAISSLWGPQWKSDSRCKVIYNGVDVSAFETPPDMEGVKREFGFPEDCPLYIHVGRLVKVKNHQRLLLIFQEVLKREPEARLLLVGWGDKKIERQVCKQIELLGIKERVYFAGERSDVPRLLKAADLLIFPSLKEGLGGVILEACAAGTPVLANDIPAVREIANHFSLVHRLSLKASDEDWATTARKVRIQAGYEGTREEDAQRFAESVFTISNSIKQHCSIWGG